MSPHAARRQASLQLAIQQLLDLCRRQPVKACPAQGRDDVVMDLLGHSQISLTANTYSHIMPELRREAADRMEAILGG